MNMLNRADGRISPEAISDSQRLERIEALLQKLVANTTPVAVHTSYSIDDLSGKPNAMRMQRTSREDDQVGKGGV